MSVLRPAALESGKITDAPVLEIRRSGIRIVLVLLYHADKQCVASLAREEGMITAGWAWMLTNEDLIGRTMAGWLYFRRFLSSTGTQAFVEQVSTYSSTGFSITLGPGSVDLTYSTALYDAIMLYARAATTVLSEGGNLRDGEAVTAAVRSTTFEGVQGHVALDVNGDRIESYEVMNFVLRADDVMSSVAVGLYNSRQRQHKAYERVVWPGNTMEVPIDFLLSSLCDAINVTAKGSSKVMKEGSTLPIGIQEIVQVDITTKARERGHKSTKAILTPLKSTIEAVLSNSSSQMLELPVTETGEYSLEIRSGTTRIDGIL